MSSYVTGSRGERIADNTVHLLGVTGAVAGAIFLTVWGLTHSGLGQGMALAVYGLALVGTFTASAFYHMAPWDLHRPLLRRIDHAAIYTMIAGTYTPLVVMLGTAMGYAILALVWVLALFGAVRKLWFWRAPGRLGPVLYLAMGWMSVGLIWGLWPLLPGAAFGLIVAGGALYSIGVIFYAWEGLKYANAIWHGFVLVASGCFFAAIAMGVAAST